MNKLGMARVIVQAKRAHAELPDSRDKMVKRIAALPLKDIREMYQLAEKAMSAMRWNTMLSD